ncbi:hypothetical protein pclt_cds_1081 [Pandoravirus celtis]|uniref:Uncharacterized protein n=1 Tax=Pandoravirus celtis TaxID=2568002 RepID=A0A4D6EIX2_9VIRU|nr:hypothetical protein pclt_cds_1081 [Pandoravirus celtis]
MFRRRRWEVWPVLRTARSDNCRRPIHHLLARITIPSQISFFSALVPPFRGTAVADASGTTRPIDPPFFCLLSWHRFAFQGCGTLSPPICRRSRPLSVIASVGCTIAHRRYFSFSFCRQEAIVVDL